MTVITAAGRKAHGKYIEAEILGRPGPEPKTPYQSAQRDWVFAQVWPRPGLDRRSRYLIALASTTCAADGAMAKAYARGALKNGELTLPELREAALHLAGYCAFSEAGVLDAAITEAAAELGLADQPFAPLQAHDTSQEARMAAAGDSFRAVMVGDGPGHDTGFFEEAVLGFAFAELWTRPGLDQRSRRWLTLTGAGYSATAVPIGNHVWSAMASGNATPEEMHEFVLQFSIHCGFPRGSVMQAAVFEQAAKIAQGERYGQ